jgi:alpha-amylase
MSKVYLILSIHNHQPVGNFDHVIEDAYEKAYLPFLKMLALHPKLKLVLHYSGNLLVWLEKKHPEAIDMITALIRAGRVELLSGGFYEPVLCSLPEDDRVMQIREMTAYIKDMFGYTPRGMWLAERVWEPNMPKYISKAGIEYLPLDDYHFKLAGVDDRDLMGYHVTEENGFMIKVFPGSEELRYSIPFKDVDAVMSYLKEVSMTGGSPLLTLADDGEKFGVWPDTFSHCYKDGWLESFFSALEENSDWIETTTFSEYQERFYPVGMVYLPAASYREMGEWALPPEGALDYEYALNELKGLFGDRAKSFLRGGTWRSFFAKYPESNHIHKRMLQISRKVHKAVKRVKVQSSKFKIKKSNKTLNSKLLTPNSLLHELWKGQCNDAYWHGIFGGLYLPHLRSSLYRHLLNAESMAEKLIGEDVSIEEGDLDCDGFRDICISKGDMTAFFTEDSGALIELSSKGKQVNVLDVLTRRPEAYHSRISETSQNGSGEPKTIHDRLSAKESGITDYLIYDNYRRTSLLDHFFDYNIRLDKLMRSEYDEKGDFIGSPYLLERINEGQALGIRLSREGLASGNNVKIDKSVLFRKSGIRVDYMIEGRHSGIFATEFNLSFLGSPYPSIHAGGKALFMKDKGAHSGVKSFYIKDEFLNMKLEFSFDEKVDVWHYPIETVSLSESGVERLYQGTACLFMKKIDFNGNKRLGFNVSFADGL